MAARMHDDEVTIDEALVRRLVVEQFPEFADRSLASVQPWGTDNAIWRLGEDLVLRLPRIYWANEQADHEARWLPVLAPHLPVAVPEPIAVGEPGCGYPYRWAINRWVPGNGATLALMEDPVGFAEDLAGVVRGLWNVPVDAAPAASGRALPLRQYADAAQAAIESAGDLIDVTAARRAWDDAIAAAPYAGPPVWVHGDLDGNCLVRAGRLCGLVDWGSACIGDPAVDVQVVWSPLFTAESRRAFLNALEVDEATLRRSRGAAIQQACAALPYYQHSYPLIVERSWHKLAALGIASHIPGPIRGAEHTCNDSG
jgi:aminoglycoside phosphotransferase (APT) family kinase protein